MPRHANDAFILAHADAKLDDSALKVPPGVGRKAEEHETPAHGGNRECSCKVLKLSGQRQGRGRAVRRDRWTTPPRLPLQRKAEVCEGTAHKNAQPTHTGWNAQPPDLYLLSKDDPQQMHYRHDEKQRGGDRHISFRFNRPAFPPRAQQPPTVAYGYELRDALQPSGMVERGSTAIRIAPVVPSLHMG